MLTVVITACDENLIVSYQNNDDMEKARDITYKNRDPNRNDLRFGGARQRLTRDRKRGAYL